MPIGLLQSTRRQVVVLVIAVVGFVFMYETRMFDSRSALWQSMTQGRSPRPGSQLPFSATAYCKGTTTASGVGVRTGIAAADTAILPVGSVLNIAAGDSRYNGVYTVMDTGPKIQGHRLDLYMWSCHEALSFGRKDVQVTVLRLGWDPRATSPTMIDRLFRRRDARPIPPPDPPPPAGIAPEDPPVEVDSSSSAEPDQGEPQ
ncbi:MAG TPA: 3D domain-containing protein [Vicinamibacterales bacterium]|nr:3D domain-containing protein [Vicinamibacterales bacterium]